MKVTKPNLFGAGTRGFTLVELLVVITIIVVLASIGFYGMRSAMDSSRRAASIGNLRQLGVGVVMFTTDNNNYLPSARYGGKFWPEALYPYINKQDVFLRPGSKDVPMTNDQPEGYFDGVTAKTPEDVPIRWNYTINGGGRALPFSEYPDNPFMARGYARPLSTIEDPARTVFFADGTSWWLNGEAKPDSNRIYRWRNGTTNVLFGDGSARNLNPKTDLTANDFLAEKK